MEVNNKIRSKTTVKVSKDHRKRLRVAAAVRGMRMFDFTARIVEFGLHPRNHARMQRFMQTV